MGKTLRLKNFALKIKDVVGYKGKIVHDTSKPDGTMKKLMDVSFANSLGLKTKVSLDEGLKKTYSWFWGICK